MARYRKIDAGIWGDEKFRALSHPSKLVYFFLFTHPHMTMLGAMRATLPGLAAELGMRRKLFVHAFSEIVANGFAKHDEGASFFWFPDSLKSDKPESPNVVRSWAKAFDLLPECPLKHELFQIIKAYAEGLTEAFQEAFREAFAKTSPNPEAVTESRKPRPEGETSEERLRAVDAEREPDSVDARILSEQVGIFGLREHEAMQRCIIAYAKASGKSPPQVIEHMVGRWSEYQKAHLRWHYGSSHKFFMSGRWDRPETWDLEETDGQPNATDAIDRIFAKEAQRRGISGVNGADAPDGAAVPVKGSGAEAGELHTGFRAARGAPHFVRRA